MLADSAIAHPYLLAGITAASVAGTFAWLIYAVRRARVDGANGTRFVLSVTVAVIWLCTQAALWAFILHDIDEAHKDRAVTAIEAKYDVTVGVPAGRVASPTEKLWVIDGEGMKCALRVDDWTDVDPILVCDGHELPH